MANAARILLDGGLVVFPTETVYGLGADAGNHAACQAVYAAKGRPADNPLIVHLYSLEQLEDCVAELPDAARRLYEAFSPGPLTIVLPKSERICDAATAGLPTVGIRFPSHPVARRFLEAVRTPVAGPSANMSGRSSTTSFQMAVEHMKGRVDGIIDGGDCTVGLESTILGFDDAGRVRILRPGAVTYEMIRDLLGDEAVVKPTDYRPNVDRPEAPGMKYAHYQPRAAVYLMAEVDAELLETRFPNDTVGYIGLVDPSPVAERVKVRTFPDLTSYARNLYRSFHDFDEQGCTIIVAEVPPRTGLGVALMDRLDKAAEGRVL
ncbi:Sua5/YciO/YrdC/YwlC family protein [Spirochaeta africana DSM 8902]|uniref:Threonylcarbamoyl-AMP synthase n=1 Tax=Spirochaeta africana (strain ATCC 700263 / DSM 8902 / Z-7692) TaxID=889378 RepID=H9UJR1_SPIAZ|nr:Sua5/YciO/YrdC/YwlC family protein [Spirochaeta africana DSM 8902]